MTSNKDILQVNVENVIKSKAPKAYKKIPGFFIRLIEMIIRQKELNNILSDRKYSELPNGLLHGVDFASGVLTTLNVDIELVGEENIPTDGKFIFASNHPLGGLDGMALISFFGKRYNNNIRFIVNDLLMHLENLASVFIPINKHGNQSKDNAKAINDEFDSENQILIFPAGLCSRLQGDDVKDLEWKKAVIAKSIEFKRDIIPLYFDGENSGFFYKFAKWRKALGIKANIEMALLPGEMLKNNNKTFKVRVGKPISWQTFDKTKSQRAWAEYLKNKVYQLKQSN